MTDHHQPFAGGRRPDDGLPGGAAPNELWQQESDVNDLMNVVPNGTGNPPPAPYRYEVVPLAVNVPEFLAAVWHQGWELITMTCVPVNAGPVAASPLDIRAAMQAVPQQVPGLMCVFRPRGAVAKLAAPQTGR